MENPLLPWTFEGKHPPSVKKREFLEVEREIQKVEERKEGEIENMKQLGMRGLVYLVAFS